MGFQVLIWKIKSKVKEETWTVLGSRSSEDFLSHPPRGPASEAFLNHPENGEHDGFTTCFYDISQRSHFLDD